MGKLSASQTDAGALAFLSPPDRSVYHLAVGLSSADQRLLIQLSGSPALQGITLWIDGTSVATFSSAPFEFWWPLEVGKHTLRAMAPGPKGESVEVEVTIEVKP